MMGPNAALFRIVVAAAGLAVCLGAASPAAARPESPEETAPQLSPSDAARQKRYVGCLNRAQNDPGVAREEAARWEAAGGGALARHCAAIALIGQGAEREAAAILTETGSAPESALSADERASMLRLAGALWLRLGQTALAARCFETVLKLDPEDRDSQVGAARAAAADGDLAAAEKHLDSLLAAQPRDAEALTLRAAARRLQGRPDPARTDATLATELLPESALAWFERGGGGARTRRKRRRAGELAARLRLGFRRRSGRAGALRASSARRRPMTRM